MAAGNGWEVFWVVTGSALICGTWFYLWALAKARGKWQAQVILVALWLVLLAMTIIMGPPSVIVMGGATVLMALWIYTHKLWWL